MKKSEKRNFKLYVKRNASARDLQIIRVFDTLDKMKEYDEKLLLQKTKRIKKQQLSNIKAHLYRQLLSSLRLIKEEDNIDIYLHEQMDYARILYNKGLHGQSLKILERLKETAKANQQLTFLQQALFFEKKIEGLFITRSMQDRADRLSVESAEASKELSLVNHLSNLSLRLYSWYIRHGLARNEKDIRHLQDFFDRNFPVEALQAAGFYERLYLYQSFTWYAFIRQDFLQYYRYAQKWVNLFEEYPGMLKVETTSYIKGFHNLMSAQFNLLSESRLSQSIRKLEQFLKQKYIQQNENNLIQVYQYLYSARINLYFLRGTFTKGLRLVPVLESMLKKYGLYLDTHRVLVFYYKIACLYFGSGDNEKAIDYLNRIINQKGDLRSDLQCYARLLHLIAHYELGSFELLEYLIKSVYRYMAKLGSLSGVEEEIFGFLRRSLHNGRGSLQSEFIKLLAQLKKYHGNPLESRAFAYLDIVSWLESKISGVNVQDVIREKFLKERNKE